jgi:ABC-type uncharacterized transport system substrate-binding protein
VNEIIAFGPDVIVTGSTPVAQLLRNTEVSVPTVFVGVADPVGSGLVASSTYRPIGVTRLSLEYTADSAQHGPLPDSAASPASSDRVL